MAYENLLVERDDAVLVMTINRPKVLNALNAGTLAELGEVIAGAQADDAVRAIVLTGAGEKSFVAGADINELAVQTPVGGRGQAPGGPGQEVSIERGGNPVFAAVDGFARGGGCERGMAWTGGLGADTARVGPPLVGRGLIPG
jgi:enoyl-CoA hydratase